MEQNKRKKKGRSATKIIPPKKKKTENLSRDEVRSINKKKIRRKRKAKRLALLAGLALVVACAGVALVLAVFFRISTIQVKGDKVYSEKDVVAKSGVEIGDNLFLANEEKVNESLTAALPYIDKITLELDLPDTIIINVTATREVAALPYGAGFILVDENGKVLDRNAAMIRDGVAIVDGVQLKGAPVGGVIKLNNDQITSRFIELLGAIKSSGFKQLTGIVLTKAGEFQLKYDDRITVKIGSFVNLEQKIRRAEAAIEKENEINAYSIGVMDVSVEPYASFDPGEESKVPVTKAPATQNASEKADENTATEDEAEAPEDEAEESNDTVSDDAEN
ncbi:MAG: FtsQ-type POTRA domain-containing protein [Clostridia bacterium]|jgi:cell division septal protein FtsQ|nr:FtsQ-type POTRA domain-containing protein [Clostridia bacterium]